MRFAWLLVGALSAPAGAATLTLQAFDSAGAPLAGPAFLSYIAPAKKRANPTAAASAVYVSDLYDAPAGGRPWLAAEGAKLQVTWTGAKRIKISLPWPVAEDGFSTVVLDNDGEGYKDGDTVLLNDAIAETEYRLLRDSVRERTTAWEPNYKPSAKAKELQNAAQQAMADAKREVVPSRRAALYEKALTRVSAAWGKILFEHGAQVAASPKAGPALRWGLTLDETLANRVGELETVGKRVAASGANWVRLVFQANAEDFTYSQPRSFLAYDAAVAELAKRKVHVMGSVLDGTMWPRTLEPKLAAARAHNLVLHYKDTIRSWEVGTELNGNWLGGAKHPLPEETVFKCAAAAAAEVKKLEPALETVATVYWWEGTAFDDAHPTFSWLKRAVPQGVFKQIDVVGLDVFPDDNPMGLAFDPAFKRLHQALPDQRLMLGAFGYVEGKNLDGYWWLDPADVDGARKDLLILYTGAAPAVPRPLGGGFWWQTLSTMMPDSPGGDSLLKIYRRTLDRLGR